MQPHTTYPHALPPDDLACSRHYPPLSHVATKDPSPKARKEPKQKTLWKTELCNSWRETGECRFGKNCDFAHSAEELRVLERPANWKTKLCVNFLNNGYCQYGRRCGFIHQGEPSPVAAGPRAQVLVGAGRGRVRLEEKEEGVEGPTNHQVDLLELMSVRIAMMEAARTSVMGGTAWTSGRPG
ncbi:hypothetical protein DFJ73DRAFT_668391 [Zopfochytrium polystomum]|nr:hypothetical protein DFJ73DRAFT_668391 [Zopfochytrium polystomum]